MRLSNGRAKPDRMERPATIPRNISSRSESDSVRNAVLLAGGPIPGFPSRASAVSASVAAMRDQTGWQPDLDSGAASRFALHLDFAARLPHQPVYRP